MQWANEATMLLEEAVGGENRYREGAGISPLGSNLEIPFAKAFAIFLNSRFRKFQVKT